MGQRQIEIIARRVDHGEGRPLDGDGIITGDGQAVRQGLGDLRQGLSGGDLMGRCHDAACIVKGQGPGLVVQGRRGQKHGPGGGEGSGQRGEEYVPGQGRIIGQSLVIERREGLFPGDLENHGKGVGRIHAQHLEHRAPSLTVDQGEFIDGVRIVHARIEAGNVLGLGHGVVMGGVRVGQRGMGHPVDGHGPAAHQVAVCQGPVAFAGKGEGVVHEKIFTGHDAAVDGQGTTDGIQGFTQGREDLHVAAVNEVIVDGRDGDDLGHVPVACVEHDLGPQGQTARGRGLRRIPGREGAHTAGHHHQHPVFKRGHGDVESAAGNQTGQLIGHGTKRIGSGQVVGLNRVGVEMIVDQQRPGVPGRHGSRQVDFKPGGPDADLDRLVFTVIRIGVVGLVGVVGAGRNRHDVDVNLLAKGGGPGEDDTVGIGQNLGGHGLVIAVLIGDGVGDGKAAGFIHRDGLIDRVDVRPVVIAGDRNGRSRAGALGNRQRFAQEVHGGG
ncbi:hypothetical protein [Desulfatiferula olefinivorans]